MIDVHSVFFVYLENPNPYLPVKKSKACRPSKNYRTDKKAKGVGEIVSSILQSNWKIIDLRDITRGRLEGRAYRNLVYIWDDKSTEIHRWHWVAKKIGRLNVGH